MSSEFEKFIIKVVKIVLFVWLFIISFKFIVVLGAFLYAYFTNQL